MKKFRWAYMPQFGMNMWGDIVSVPKRDGQIVRNLTDAGIGEGEVGALVKTVCAEKTWNVALSFDCFTGRFPEPSRVDANSTYDAIAGIECTYENLHALPKALGRQNSVRMRFIPKTQKVKVVFDQVRTFRSVLERPEALPFRTGALGDLYALASKIMEMRDTLIAQLKARRQKGAVKGQPMNRAQLVAGVFGRAVICRLAGAGKRLQDLGA